MDRHKKSKFNQLLSTYRGINQIIMENFIKLNVSHLRLDDLGGLTSETVTVATPQVEALGDEQLYGAGGGDAGHFCLWRECQPNRNHADGGFPYHLYGFQCNEYIFLSSGSLPPGVSGTPSGASFIARFRGDCFYL
jgi:hypothetical protein